MGILRKSIVFILFFVLILLAGCDSTNVFNDVEITATGMPIVEIAITETAVLTTTQTPLPHEPVVPSTDPPTALEATATLTPLPLETAVSANIAPPNRQQLFAQLVKLNIQLIEEATLLKALVEDHAMDTSEWMAVFDNSLSAIENINQQFVNIAPSQAGRQAYTQNGEAFNQCLDVAERLGMQVAETGQEEVAQFEPDFSVCIFGLDKMNGLLTRQENANSQSEDTAVNLVGCEGVSTGFVPLPELGSGLYQEMMGGLYPNGLNERPPAHEATGLNLADEIIPINGQIVLLSIGMSNTRNEFDYFIDGVNSDPEVNPAVLPVNGAIPGRPSQTIDLPDANYWDLVENRLRRAGVAPEDVQVIWLKQAHGYPKRPFPDDALTFETELRNIVQIIPIKYPNVKQVFLSSRIYAGYAITNLSPEPHAYQAGFGVKWVVEDYINGDLPNSPWISWGPYLWGDGETPRHDGLTWICDDFEKDGIHPATGGREKVAQLLLDFFKTDSVTRGWFLNGAE